MIDGRPEPLQTLLERAALADDLLDKTALPIDERICVDRQRGLEAGNL